MTPKLVIFDCDGVLVDTEPATNKVIAADLASHGLVIPEDDMVRMFVGGTMKGVETKAREMGANLPEDWLDQIYAKMFAVLGAGVDVFAEVDLFLDALDAREISYAIASNGPLPKMAISLAPSGLLDRFAGRIYSGHDYAPKPAPDTIIHAMQVAGVTADETIFIDDSPSGAGAGINAGVRTFGFDPSGIFAHLGGVDVERVKSMRNIAGLIGVNLAD